MSNDVMVAFAQDVIDTYETPGVAEKIVNGVLEQGKEKREPIPYCKYLISRSSGQIFPYSKMLAQEPQFFEPYYGEVREKQPIEIAMSQLAEIAQGGENSNFTELDRQRVIKVMSDYNTGKLVSDAVVRIANDLMVGRYGKFDPEQAAAAFNTSTQEVYAEEAMNAHKPDNTVASTGAAPQVSATAPQPQAPQPQAPQPKAPQPQAPAVVEEAHGASTEGTE